MTFPELRTLWHKQVNTTRNLRRLSTIVFERIKVNAVLSMQLTLQRHYSDTYCSRYQDFQDSRLFMSIRKVLEFTTIEALMRKRQQ